MDKAISEYAQQSIDGMAHEFVAMTSDIWSHPEIGNEEYRTSGILCDSLESHGFDVVRGICDMPTAFIAHRGSGSPNVYFTAEYDALPNLGHACGHNLFCCSAIAAATAYANWLESNNLPGTATVIGGPAEEGGAVDNGGGKVPLVDSGYFADADIAMISHADGSAVIERRLNAGATLSVAFRGKPAHAGGSPEKGINALTAGMLTITNINACRQQFGPMVRVNPVIRETSDAANTIPEFCEMRINVRAYDKDEFDSVIAKVHACIKAAALVSGCSEEHRFVSHPTEDLVPNHAMGLVWRGALDELGVPATQSDERGYCWDMGNVSRVCPTLAPYLKIGPDTLVGHTPEFRECANSDLGHKAMLDAAKCMAMLAMTYESDKSFRCAVHEEFNLKFG